jgi:metal-responsive CopG/Arc/MetJ family transcriptional regulator
MGIEVIGEVNWMARPKKPDAMETISVRLPAPMTKELDIFIEELRADMPLLPISRTDAVRQLLAMALEARRKGKKRKS